MKEREIRKLIRIVEESEIEELEVRTWWMGRRVRISKRAALAIQQNGGGAVQTVALASLAEAATAGPAVAGPAGTIAEEFSEDRYHIIHSPIVGTFYRAPAPDTPPYVEEGDTIKAGQVVCIVEAMKLMNEIQAEKGGKVVRVAVENAEPVEYNQMLIVIDPED
jgi:acetyl-CoA carboxylase biotin carboxyl carrier protein